MKSITLIWDDMLIWQWFSTISSIAMRLHSYWDYKQLSSLIEMKRFRTFFMNHDPCNFFYGRTLFLFFVLVKMISSALSFMLTIFFEAWWHDSSSTMFLHRLFSSSTCSVWGERRLSPKKYWDFRSSLLFRPIQGVTCRTILSEIGTPSELEP